jgi:hypothetical protein
MFQTGLAVIQAAEPSSRFSRQDKLRLLAARVPDHGGTIALK